MGSESLAANWADLEALDPRLITSYHIGVSTVFATKHLPVLLGSQCSLHAFAAYELNELN